MLMDILSINGKTALHDAAGTYAVQAAPGFMSISLIFGSGVADYYVNRVIFESSMPVETVEGRGWTIWMNKKRGNPIREMLPWFGPGMAIDPNSMASFL